MFIVHFSFNYSFFVFFSFNIVVFALLFAILTLLLTALLLLLSHLIGVPYYIRCYALLVHFAIVLHYCTLSCFRFCALLFILLHYSCPCFLCCFVIHALLLALPCYSSLVAFVVLLFMLSCSRLVTLALHLDVLLCLLLGLVALSSCFLPYHCTLLLCHHCPTIMPCYLAITP
jgi:hypothetical protein